MERKYVTIKPALENPCNGKYVCMYFIGTENYIYITITFWEH